MYDPRRQGGYDQLPAGLGGVVSAFLPQGMVGVLGGLFLLLLLAILSDWVEGFWLVLAVAGLVALVPLIGVALKREMRRQDMRRDELQGNSRLPDNAELSDEERREAMRGFENERPDR
jgi:predicted lipid-binding transport protein (Tim44 family)